MLLPNITAVRKRKSKRHETNLRRRRQASGDIGKRLDKNKATAAVMARQERNKRERAMFSSSSDGDGDGDGDDSWRREAIHIPIPIPTKKRKLPHQDSDFVSPSVSNPPPPHRSSSAAIKRKLYNAEASYLDDMYNSSTDREEDGRAFGKAIGDHPALTPKATPTRQRQQQQRGRSCQGQKIAVKKPMAKPLPPPKKARKTFFKNSASDRSHQVTGTDSERKLDKDTMVKAKTKATYEDLVPNTVAKSFLPKKALNKKASSDEVKAAKDTGIKAPSSPIRKSAVSENPTRNKLAKKKPNLRQAAKVSYTELDDNDKEDRDEGVEETIKDSSSRGDGLRKQEGRDGRLKDKIFKTYARNKPAASGDCGKSAKEIFASSKGNDSSSKKVETKRDTDGKWHTRILETDDEDVHEEEESLTRKEKDNEANEFNPAQPGAGDQRTDAKDKDKDKEVVSRLKEHIKEVVEQAVGMEGVMLRDTPKTRRHLTPPNALNRVQNNAERITSGRNALSATVESNLNQEEEGRSWSLRPPPRLMESVGGSSSRGSLSQVICALVEDELELFSKRVSRRIADAVVQQLQ